MPATLSRAVFVLFHMAVIKVQFDDFNTFLQFYSEGREFSLRGQRLAFTNTWDGKFVARNISHPYAIISNFFKTHSEQEGSRCLKTVEEFYLQNFGTVVRDAWNVVSTTLESFPHLSAYILPLDSRELSADGIQKLYQIQIADSIKERRNLQVSLVLESRWNDGILSDKYADVHTSSYHDQTPLRTLDWNHLLDPMNDLSYCSEEEMANCL